MLESGPSLAIEESRGRSEVTSGAGPVTFRGRSLCFEESRPGTVTPAAAASPAVDSPAAAASQAAAASRLLVLSLFPGVDLLGRTFSAVGCSVVAGPDLILDQRIEDFHVPSGRFDGLIGGPPCQNYSDANRNRDAAEGDRLVLEYLRVVDESQPTWWLMENVRNVPHVQLRGYRVQRLDCVDWEFGGPSGRLRHIQFGHKDGWIIRPLRTQTTRSVTPVPTVTTASTGPGDRYSRRCAKMGISPLALGAFTPAARRRVIGNGVPWGMGAALAAAVLAAGPVTDSDCVCGCGRTTRRAGSHATVACRQRTSRRRRGHIRELVYA
jgi:DNA (cytosine-5)-methyltransferase 1